MYIFFFDLIFDLMKVRRKFTNFIFMQDIKKEDILIKRTD